MFLTRYITFLTLFIDPYFSCKMVESRFSNAVWKSLCIWWKTEYPVRDIEKLQWKKHYGRKSRFKQFFQPPVLSQESFGSKGKSFGINCLLQVLEKKIMQTIFIRAVDAAETNSDALSHAE